MKKMTMAAMMLAVILAASLTGCGTNSAAGSTASNSSSVSTAARKSASAAAAENGNTSESYEAVALSQDAVSSENSGDAFTKRDLAQTADTSDAQTITVSDGQTIDITAEGVYVISGTAQNCTIRVNAGETAKVQLVLDGVSITNTDSPAIYAVSADKVFVTTADSENTLTVSGQFTADGDTNTDAVIFSKDDLVLNGTGTLNIVSNYGNGITGKDDLKITGGTYNVQSALDAVEANDSISVCGGVFTINSDKDGLHCENDEAEGTVTISGGTFTISAKSDGIQAAALLQIDGGSMTITASEGLEATYVRINDGTVKITASDDGINAAQKSALYSSPVIEINGGDLTVAVGQGDTDAIDSNGSIYVNGGTINITAQMSSFDYDRTAEFNGGTIIINGQEVSEIPQSMMGGGMGGGMRGNMQGGMGGGRQR